LPVATPSCQHRRVSAAPLATARLEPADADPCVDVWLAALRERDGHEPAPGTAERAATKLASPWVTARGVRDATTPASGASGSPAPRLLGFALVTEPGSGHAADPADAAYLSMLAVAPGHARRGLGGALLDAVVADARASGHARLVLHVVPQNEAAVRLYRSHGWRPDGELHRHPVLGLPVQSYLFET
jgi:ribosomal protein S18 acetylase RimI-like enzyme